MVAPDRYRAYALGCGISSQVYLADAALGKEAEALFNRLRKQGYLLDYFNREQAASMGLDGPFDYVLESADGYSIISEWTDEFETLPRRIPGVEGFGNHGHLPARGDQPPFIVSDRRIAGCTEVEQGNMLDIAPTLCRMHHLDLWDMQGRPIREIEQRIR